MATAVKHAPSSAPKKKTDEKPVEFAFGRENYVLLLIGLALIILGFILMVGGGSSDPKVFNEAIFDFQRLTLAPILILAGFVVELIAIIKKPKD
jgi:membrane-bound ClpP family serine protease